MSRWIKCISSPGNLRAVSIQATRLIQDLVDRHELTGAGAQRMGEAAIGALLLSSHCKSGERVNLNIRGSNIFSTAVVDAYPEGYVRGFVSRGFASHESPLEPMDEQGPWGSGLISVLRTKGIEKREPYIGTVPMLTGHLAKDLTYYWFQSEQIPSAVGIGVRVKGSKVEAAGGFLVQALPGATSLELRSIEQNLHDLQKLSEHFSEKDEPIQVLSKIFKDRIFTLIEERPLQFRCDCSWDRVERSLALLGEKELRSMAEEGPLPLDVSCDFCSKKYPVDRDHLEKIISQVKR